MRVVFSVSCLLVLLLKSVLSEEIQTVFEEPNVRWELWIDCNETSSTVFSVDSTATMALDKVVSVLFVPTFAGADFESFAVQTHRDNYAVQNLNRGKDLSYELKEDGSIEDFADTSKWHGTAEAKNRLLQHYSCVVHNITDSVYHAKGNHNGLHILHMDNWCRFDYDDNDTYAAKVYAAFDDLPTTTEPMTTTTTTDRSTTTTESTSTTALDLSISTEERMSTATTMEQITSTAKNLLTTTKTLVQTTENMMTTAMPTMTLLPTTVPITSSLPLPTTTLTHSVSDASVWWKKWPVIIAVAIGSVVLWGVCAFVGYYACDGRSKAKMMGSEEYSLDIDGSIHLENSDSRRHSTTRPNDLFITFPEKEEKSATFSEEKSEEQLAIEIKIETNASMPMAGELEFCRSMSDSLVDDQPEGVAHGADTGQVTTRDQGLVGDAVADEDVDDEMLYFAGSDWPTAGLRCDGHVEDALSDEDLDEGFSDDEVLGGILKSAAVTPV